MRVNRRWITVQVNENGAVVLASVFCDATDGEHGTTMDHAADLPASVQAALVKLIDQHRGEVDAKAAAELQKYADAAAAQEAG